VSQDRGRDNLRHSGRSPFGLPSDTQEAQFSIRPCPVTHTESALAVDSSLHPRKCTGLVFEAPALNTVQPLLQLGHSRPQKETTVLFCDVFNGQSVDVRVSHYCVFVCSPALSCVGLIFVVPSWVGVDDGELHRGLYMQYPYRQEARAEIRWHADCLGIGQWLVFVL